MAGRSLSGRHALLSVSPSVRSPISAPLMGELFVPGGGNRTAAGRFPTTGRSLRPQTRACAEAGSTPRLPELPTFGE